nr:histone lysine N methyltransferase SETMAR [Hymenolepis microstoma]
MKKSADWLRLPRFSDTYGKTAISGRTCRREWFQCLRSGDFAVEDRHGGGGVEKVVEDAELEVIHSDESCQTQEELSE